jgi:hypothetical protein
MTASNLNGPPAPLDVERLEVIGIRAAQIAADN